jgi:hypothetical protein
MPAIAHKSAAAEESSAAIAQLMKKLGAELEAARRDKEKTQTTRNDILLRGDDDELSKYDSKTRSTLDDLERTIRDREFQIPNLKERHRIATEKENKAAIEDARTKAYADAGARLDLYNKKISGEVPVFAASSTGKTVADVTACLVALVREERDLYELCGRINRDLPTGAQPLGMPGAEARFSPAVSGVRAGVKAIATRLKKSIAESSSRHRPGGSDSYETFLTEPAPAPKGLEAFVGDGEPAFNPPPLFRTMEIPPLFKGSPSYRIPSHLK